MGENANRPDTHGSGRGVAAVDLPRKGNQSQDPQHNERSLQSRDPLGFRPHQSDYGPRARLWCAPKCQAGAYSDVLDVGEFQALLGELQLRERVMLWVGMTTGLRRGELAGLRWCDVNFEKLTIDVLRSVVDQRVGKVK